MLVQPPRLTSTHSRMAWPTDTVEYLECLVLVYYRLSYTREGGEGESKRERVSPTAHTQNSARAL